MELNRLGRGSFGNAFTKLYDLDDLNAVSTLAPEILPVIDLWARPEFWALCGGRLGYFSLTQAAGGAGVTIRSSLDNLRDGLLAVVESIRINNASTYLVALDITSGLFRGFSNQPPKHRDGRMVPGGSINVGLGIQPTVLAGPSLAPAGLRLVGPGTFDIPFVLVNGKHLYIEGGDNQAVDWSVTWRERQASETELNLL